jgi:hypothetical protein
VGKHRGVAGRGSCPPHGPIMVAAFEEDRYVASCLACGVAGPEREDSWEAKLAFDEAISSMPTPRRGHAGDGIGPYSPERVEGALPELRSCVVLRSLPIAAAACPSSLPA